MRDVYNGEGMIDAWGKGEKRGDFVECRSKWGDALSKESLSATPKIELTDKPQIVG